MRIGIITELSNETVNYGNVLQAYALNYYLNNKNSLEAETLIVNSFINKKITSYNPFILLKKIISIIKKNTINSNKEFDFNDRKSQFKEFLKRIKTREVLDWDELTKTDYDCLIVGSDVVWIQDRGMVNRIKFLDFKAKKKISYAASFGRDYIPKENMKFIKKCLEGFESISVREKSSVEMLNKIGIDNVKHVCDPTLLLNKNEWKKIEKKVNINDRYVFVYLLGKDQEQRNHIKEYAKTNNLKIVSIPHANGEYNSIDDNFADIDLINCSPEEWIYLIDNSEMIFTDSFHGVVFSTMLNKNFISLRRNDSIDINNRVEDYLRYIDQEDKTVFIDNEFSLDKEDLSYSTVNKKLDKFVSNSKEYLDDSIN